MLAASDFPEATRGLKRLRLAVMRLLQQIAIGWVLRFTPNGDVETILAISALLDATDIDAEKR